MSTSYDGSLLDHLAEYMIYLSTASSFWFSLDSSYDHEFHLSKRFGMSPQDYEHLLVAAHLAHFYTKFHCLNIVLLSSSHLCPVVVFTMSSSALSLSCYHCRTMTSPKRTVLPATDTVPFSSSSSSTCNPSLCQLPYYHTSNADLCHCPVTSAARYP